MNMKTMIKKNLSKKDSSLIDYFDVVFVEFLELRQKWGKDNQMVIAEKWKAIGILNSLRIMEIVSYEMMQKVMDCLFQKKYRVL